MNTTLYFIGVFIAFFAILGTSCLVVAVKMKGWAFVLGTMLVTASDHAADLRHWLFHRQYEANSRLLMSVYGRSYVAVTRFLTWAETMLMERHRSWAIAIDYIGLWDEQVSEHEWRLLLEREDGPKHRADEPYDQERDA